MLRDLLILEHYFDRANAVFSIDTLLQCYSECEVNYAFSNGYIETKTFCVSNHANTCLCWLSEKGRCIASETS